MLPFLAEPLTFEHATRAAEILVTHHWVDEVLLFGSIARDRTGNDVDLILVVPDAQADRFLLRMQDRMAFSSAFYSNAHGRLNVVASVMGMSFYRLLREAERHTGALRIDLFIFPHTWKEQLQYLQQALPHEDPKFMENIARDAIKIA